ncbi:hypothetical protein [Streptomyces sp. ISL-11]|uniref:hypothetical protein n=1 Tax=Streptomyces sp. ISL-11 TaxID=2819174 RepID=UPI001BE7E9B7|nr:hypothetical protein [Streptomyces sp. ISL-11]MBT2384975.1 hypothetical protein [Streptomyces sp. ISL-11]
MAVRPLSLPPLTLLACTDVAPYSHEPLFAPLLEAVTINGQPVSWESRLRIALEHSLASGEMRPYAHRHWGSWNICTVQGIAPQKDHRQP